MHEDKFWDSLTTGADVWRLVVIVLVVSLLLFVALRVATKAVADRRTRKILLEGMKDEDGEAEQGERDPPAKE